MTYSPLWGCAIDRVEIIVKVHSGTVLGDAFSTWRQIRMKTRTRRKKWSYRRLMYWAESLLSQRNIAQCFPNQKRRNYRWVEKRFGCYQQLQFNLHWKNSVSDWSQGIVKSKKFKMRRRRKIKKTSQSLTRQNNNVARVSRFFVHFFAVNTRLPRGNA